MPKGDKLTKKQEESVQVGLRIPAWLRDELQRIADIEHRSLNQQCTVALENLVARITQREYQDTSA